MNKLKSFALALPMRVQYTILTILAVTLLISSVITVNYIHNKADLIDAQVKNEAAVLSLEVDNMDQYIHDLITFSVQPRYDTRFMRIIENKKLINEEDIDYIRDEMRAYYYTRNDLRSLSIFMENQNVLIGRESKSQHFQTTLHPELSAEDAAAYNACNDSDYYLCITPNNDSNTLFTFYHSLIQIDNKESLAVIKANIDNSFVSNLEKNHMEKGEFIVLCCNDMLLYSGNTNLVSDESLLDEIMTFPNGNGYVTLGHEKYLVSYFKDASYGISLISFTPYAVLSQSLVKLLYVSIVQGLIAWVLAFIAVAYLTRVVTRPLATLSTKLESVGQGNFGVPILIEGNREISDLSDSFNYMTMHIADLIKENYIVRLNEQSSRLIALEAQMNPHFLYNTLQAISSEALVQGQMQIYDMITDLAAILRYTVKGGDIVTLSEEMVHVKQYFAIQKVRMNDNLTYDLDIEEETNLVRIPKISIQILVENAIIHGIGENVSKIHITVQTRLENGRVRISVSDNGQGMNEEQLQALLDTFDQSPAAGETHGIGLANLNSRLKILLDEDAGLQIESSPESGTCVTMILPIQESKNDV